MHYPPHEFLTARLRLRKPLPGDAAEIFDRWTQDAEVTRYLVWTPHRALKESQAHVASCEAGWCDGSEFVWMIEQLDEGVLVGSIAARPGVHGVNLGYLIARDAWGRGLMVEALQPVVEWWLAQQEVFRVWATCDVENVASARVLEKAGFECEGVLRRWDHHPNIEAEPRDARCYSRVQS